jgi:AP2 domain/HNH endonuclease
VQVRDLTQEYLRSILHYDRATGEFTWRVSRGSVQAGDEAGSHNQDGHLQIKIDGVCYAGSRLAWLYVKGCWPKYELDHHDLNASNNVWSNIRPATHSQNCYNKRARSDNELGVKGVSLRKKDGRYVAQISINKKYTYLGAFDAPEEAQQAYIAAAKKHHGEFMRVE